MSEHLCVGECISCHALIEPGESDTTKEISEIYAMVKEIYEMLTPLKALAAGLGPMQTMGMSPAGKAAMKRLKEIS